MVGLRNSNIFFRLIVLINGNSHLRIYIIHFEFPYMILTGSTE